MNVRRWGVELRPVLTNHSTQGTDMKDVKKYAIAGAITTVAALLGIYLLRKAPVVSGFTAPLVNKALNG